MPRKNSVASGAALPAVPVHADAALVLRRFRQIFNAVKSHFQQLEKRSGLGGAKIWALSVIEQNPGIGTGALAQAMDIHQSTTSNLVKLLIEHGLVQARKSESDRRSVQLHVLPAGRKILKNVPGPFIGVLPDALERLDTATLKNLNRDLTRLTALLSEVDEDSALTPLAEI
jgi:MarR family transcriptional regulator, organic hydroperoxide resistance regulator